MIYCYLFEATGIQSWIFSGGQMRDAAGGSALLDSVCSWTDEDDLFSRACNSLLPEDASLTVARRAGAGLYVYCEREVTLRRFRAIFTLLVRHHIPDLTFVDALETGDTEEEAFDRSQKSMRAVRNRPIFNPIAVGPFHLASPRTGAAAVERDTNTGLFIDIGQVAKRAQIKDARTELEKKFDPEGHARFPVDLSEQVYSPHASFPFHDDNRYVGLVHADGNGMGKLLISLGERLPAADIGYAEGFRLFSRAIGEATTRAAETATKTLPVVPLLDDSDGWTDIWPMRPLVLGGDDLSVIVRADRAIQFVEAFLLAFEEETEKKFDELREANDFWKKALPSYLSAGAGIAFIKSNQPFTQAYKLCESLAKHAKDTSKSWPAGDKDAPVPATLAFHRVTGSHIPEDAEHVEEMLMRKEDEHTSISLTLNPYVVSGTKAEFPDDAPTTDSLHHLCSSIERREISRGPIRELAPDFFGDEWQGSWQRMISVSEKRHPQAVTGFTECLSAFGCKEPRVSPFCKLAGGASGTPLFDALSWVAVAKGRRDRNVRSGR